MPAAAVIPALRVYMNVVVVKTLIAHINGSSDYCRARKCEVLLLGLTESSVICCRCRKRCTGSGAARRSDLLEMINFEQIRVFKTSVTRFEYISIVLQNMMDSFTPKVLLAGRKNG